MKSMRTRVGIALINGLVLGVGVAHAMDISGTISTTLTITEDSQLIGDVTCIVTGAPCIQFGAPGIRLKLNGFTMTGLADPATGCGGVLVAGEVGISSGGQHHVTIKGPGLVERFRNQGILVTGSGGVLVDGVTASTNCGSGILLAGSASDNRVERNIFVRNGNDAAACGGICIAGGSNRNQIRGNQTGGNGYVDRPMVSPNDFGIGVVSGNDNLIEENTGLGNTNGLILFTGVTGTEVRRNIFVGNPPIQVSVSFPANTGVDIRNLAAPHANIFEDNICVTSMNAPCPKFRR